jgi:hypothetical protein
MVELAPCVIEPHYHRIRVLHKDRVKTKNVIALFPGQAPPQKRPGIVYVDPEIPPENDKHIALGRFMDTWSKFELHLRNQVEMLLLTASPSSAIAVSYSVSGKALMNLLVSLAATRLSGHAKKEYADLSERFSKLNTKRNYLVHGSWTLELIVHLQNAEPAVKAQEVREFPPVDSESREDLDDFRNQSSRGRYLFTLDRIASTERDIANLYGDFRTFHNTRLK